MKDRPTPSRGVPDRLPFDQFNRRASLYGDDTLETVDRVNQKHTGYTSSLDFRFGIGCLLGILAIGVVLILLIVF